MAKDYYSVLGVDKTANEADIKQAFRKLAHEHHPDKSSGSAEKFKEINEAYQVLSDSEKRQQYDQFGQTFDGAASQGFNWQDINRGGGPFAGFSGAQGGQHDFGDLGDVLGDMFGFRSQTRGRASERGNDIQTTVSITFEESFSGVDKDVTLRMNTVCKTCNGSGDHADSKITSCKTCSGSGRVSTVRQTFLGAIQMQSICATCKGRGKESSKKCPTCHGATVTKQDQKIKVKIPPGIDESKTIRLASKGEAGQNGIQAGDLFIQVAIGDHDHFTRDGYDVLSSEEVPLSILANGDSIQIPTLAGDVKLKIPSGTRSGSKFILRDKGFEVLEGRGRGKQIVTLNAYVPNKLSSKQKKDLQEFEESVAKPLKSNRSWWK